MRDVHCINCYSQDVKFKADILVGCCQQKSGEIWYCHHCGQEMIIQVVYSDDQDGVNCPHSQLGQKCGQCNNCDKKN